MSKRSIPGIARRSPRPLALVLGLASTLAAVAGASAFAAEEPEDPPPVVLRPAAPPSELERVRMERWRRSWRQEAAALDRAFRAALRTAAEGSDRDLRARCTPLAGALLELDRKRVLPVPERAADLYLRRGLRALTHAAVACLTARPYAARGKLREAREAFRSAERVLRRYGSVPVGPAPARDR